MEPRAQNGPGSTEQNFTSRAACRRVPLDLARANQISTASGFSDSMVPEMVILGRESLEKWNRGARTLIGITSFGLNSGITLDQEGPFRL